MIRPVASFIVALCVLFVNLHVAIAKIPVIDISSLRNADHENFCPQIQSTALEILNASAKVGFFYIAEHGVPIELQNDIEAIARDFFAQPVGQKKLIDMVNGGKAWRGYFAVGDEVTSGIPDQKEGIYFGTELTTADDRPLHGTNQWPQGETGEHMKRTVLSYMGQMRTLGQLLMRAISCGLGVEDRSFASQFDNPTELFRIFNYPPHNVKFGEKALGVGEHTDYGYLTLLRQDLSGGLQVKDIRSNTWLKAEPIPNTFVVNLGDALEHATRGLLKATPHRVEQRRDAIADRISMPYFFDPCFDCEMQHIVPEDSPLLHNPDFHFTARATKEDAAPAAAQEADGVGNINRSGDASSGDGRGGGLYTRWDHADPTMFKGTYGSYLLRKVSRAFPDLFKMHINKGEL